MNSVATDTRVIVIGGGQAGLAAGYHLKQAGLPYLILDAQPRIGDSWRKRWNGLRLFSPQRYNQLPGATPSGDPLHLPDRLELADYLEEYATQHQLVVRSGQVVDEVAVTSTGFTVRTRTSDYACAQVIVATGAYHTPSVPHKLDETFPPETFRLHASEVREVADLVGSDTSVLVVGAGASGQQLARLALDTGAEVILTGPEVTNLPRKVFGKDIYWWLYGSGMMSLRCDKVPGRWLADDSRGTVTVAENTATLLARPQLTRVADHLSKYAGGQLHFSKTPPLDWPKAKKGIVLYCTGYRNSYPFLPVAAVDGEGTPLERGGISTSLPGLYYLGLPNLRHLNSSLVGGVGRDAAQIVTTMTAGY